MPLVAALLVMLLVNGLRSLVSWAHNGRMMRRAIRERRALLPDEPPRPKECTPGEMVALLGRFRVDEACPSFAGGSARWGALAACSRELEGRHHFRIGARPRLQLVGESVPLTGSADGSRLSLGTRVARLVEDHDPATYHGLRDGDAVWVVGRLQRETEDGPADYRSEPQLRHELVGPWRLFALGTVKVRFRRLPFSAVDAAAAIIGGFVVAMGGWAYLF